MFWTMLRSFTAWSSFLVGLRVALASKTITRPQLNGTHYRITVVKAENYVNFDEMPDGSLAFSGYMIDVLERISASNRANFSYELLPPSGLGSMCTPQLDLAEEYDLDFLYSPAYYRQFECGASDVNDLPKTNRTTDMYLSLFFITEERSIQNRFTAPFKPPITGAITMHGTATYVTDVPDLIEQQKKGDQGPVCVYKNVAYAEFLEKSFPELKLAKVADFQISMLGGECDIAMGPYPTAQFFVTYMSHAGNCLINGKPVGLIGEPLNFGLSQFAIGVRRDLPMDFIDTWNHWLNVLMECAPNDYGDTCQGDSLAALYAKNVGTGNECGYVQFPPKNYGVDNKMVAIIVACTVAVVMIVCAIVYSYKLKEQRRRIKKRFVQQISRNIEIGPCPGSIPIYKLAEEVQHIGDSDGNITKLDLVHWMNDVKLTFLSDKDFDALWAAIDVEGKGKVDPVEFFVFLSKCGSAFKEVYEEETTISKSERLKMAACRLSNINNSSNVNNSSDDDGKRPEDSLEPSLHGNARVDDPLANSIHSRIRSIHSNDLIHEESSLSSRDP